MSAYVELQVASNYSFLRGASHVEELFAQAAAFGYPALAITDRNSLAGIARAHQRAEETGVRLVVGCELRLRCGTNLLVYPTNRPAYSRLSRLLTLGKARGAELTGEHGGFDLGWSDLAAAAEGLLAVQLTDHDFPRLAATFGDRAHVALTFRREPDDHVRMARRELAAGSAGVAAVATGNVLYHAPGRRVLQDVVTCIREGRTIDDAGDVLEGGADRHLCPPDFVALQFSDFPDAVARTAELAARCTFSLSELRYQYPNEVRVPGHTPQQTLEALVWEQAPVRYPDGVPDPVAAQLRHELRLIATLEYAPYFLTVHSIVAFARSRGILCQGRGSAANSAVCWVIGVTAIDPVRSGLLFERFISEARREPPDIDVDFEHERREEVIQWVYEHYGRDRAALCATINRYRARGAVREVGKVMGLTEDVTALLASQVWGWSEDGVQPEHAAAVNLNLDDPTLRMTLEMARELIGAPRHMGTHPGGFVLTADRLDELVPIAPAAMDGRQVIEWDKDDIDALRFMKVDVLGLGMLGCMRRAFALLDEHRGVTLDLATIPPEDPATYAMIRRADTLGTFQIESRAQMAMLPRMAPTTFYDLVIEVAVVRPGPIQGDMVHPYLRRREGLEPVVYPTPELERVLGKTLGIPLFQEQAMQVAMVCAGFTATEADQLRRAMATFKVTGGVSHFRNKLVGGMVSRGYSVEYAERTFRQIEGFGSYGFPESHAASFALIAYASSWLKCHHPDVFCAALLNAQPMGFYAPAQVVRDAREHGVEVRPLCVNASRWDCMLEDAGGGALAVRLGLRMAKGLANADAAAIVAARDRPYAGVEEVWRRAGVKVAALERVAEADGFACFGLDRRSAVWAITGLSDDVLPLFAAADARDGTLLPEAVEPAVALPPMTPGRVVVEDYASVGLSLRQHPVAFLRAELARTRHVTCAELLPMRDGTRMEVAGIVLVRQKPGSAKGVMFITLEDETGVANVVVWPKLFERFRPLVLGAAMMGVRGRVQTEGKVTHVIAEDLRDLTALLRSVGQREAAFPLVAGRGDEARRGGPPDPRAKVKPRDIYSPEKLNPVIRVETRDFR